MARARGCVLQAAAGRQAPAARTVLWATAPRAHRARDGGGCAHPAAGRAADRPRSRQRAVMKRLLRAPDEAPVTLVIAVHHAEDLPRGMTHGLHLHNRRAYADRFLFCDLSRGRVVRGSGQDCMPLSDRPRKKDYVACHAAFGDCGAVVALAGCGHSGYAVRPVPRIAADNVGQAGEPSCKRHSASRAKSTAPRRSGCMCGFFRRSPQALPSDSTAARWKSPSMHARSACWDIPCRTSAGRPAAKWSGGFAWRER